MRRSIPPFKLVPQPLNEEAANLPPFKWTEGEEGRRHQLGGEPQFLQAPEYPECSCGEKMVFYGQLDSINDEFVLADCALIYVFACFGCVETKSIIQFT